MFLTKKATCGSTLLALILASGVLFAAGPKGIPEVDVNVVNTPDVNVANVPEVIVSNPPTNPLPVTVQESQTREPVLIKSSTFTEFTDEKTLLVGDGGTFSVCVGALPVCEDGTGRYTVPVDKQLVIKHISFSARSKFPSVIPEPVGASLGTFVSNYFWDFKFGLLDVLDPPPLNISGKGFQAEITLPPGTRLVARLVWAKPFTGGVEGEYSLAGEYIDAP